MLCTRKRMRGAHRVAGANRSHPPARSRAHPNAGIAKVRQTISKIAEERSSKYDDSNRRYYAPNQSIEPMQGKGLTVHTRDLRQAPKFS